MTIITTEIQKWKRNKIVWCILALTLLLGAFAIERACSISRSSPFMDSFGDLYTLAFKNLSSLFLPIVLGMFATTLFFDEHKNDTMKELLIIPITKAQLYFSKVAVVILMSVGLCLITFLLCVVGGLIAGGFPDLNAQTLMDAGLLYLAGGILIPIAMLPIVFLSTLSKGYILPIGATLLYLIPVVIAPAYLTGIHPLASVMGIYPHISEAAAAMVESLMQGVLFNTSPLVCVGSLLLIGATFAAASVVALKKQSYWKERPMKRLSCLLLGILLVFSLCACQQAAPSSGEAPDQQAITEEATEYFNQMMDGDFETFFNALPQGVQDNISAETIQETWEEEVDKLGGLPENTSPDVSCYVPEHSDQIRVEFVIPCDKGNFKVFINYFPDGSLYNYVIWKNETK